MSANPLHSYSFPQNTLSPTRLPAIGHTRHKACRENTATSALFEALKGNICTGTPLCTPQCCTRIASQQNTAARHAQSDGQARQKEPQQRAFPSGRPPQYSQRRAPASLRRADEFRCARRLWPRQRPGAHRPRRASPPRRRPVQTDNDPAAGSPTATLLRLTSYPAAEARRSPPSPRLPSEIVTGGVYKLQGRIHRGLLSRGY